MLRSVRLQIERANLSALQAISRKVSWFLNVGIIFICMVLQHLLGQEVPIGM